MSIEVRIVPMNRYQVTRSNGKHVTTIAENLTKSQAEDIANAIQDRALNAGKDVLPIVELPDNENSAIGGYECFDPKKHSHIGRLDNSYVVSRERAERMKRNLPDWANTLIKD